MIDRNPSSSPSFFGRPRVPVPTGSEAAAFDEWAQGEVGVHGSVLMESAGRAAADALERLHPRGRIAVLAGPGNNGGDAVVLARTLALRGRPVHLFVLGPRSDPDPLLHGWTVPRTKVGEGGLEPSTLGAFDLIVDGLLGTGIRGAPRPPHARLIEAANAAEREVVALDIPSGVDGDSGAIPGEAIRAGVTLAFGAPKLGSLLHPGRSAAGRIVAMEIGFPPWPEDAASAALITPGWATRARPRRRPVTHKNSAGRLLLLAGSEEFGGATVLSARAALRAGVGFLRVATPPVLRELLQGSVPEAVWVDAGSEDALASAVEASDAVAAGPGLGGGAGALRAVEIVLATLSERKLLLDADALSVLSPGTEEWRARALLTPHPGEAGRLLDRSPRQVASHAPEHVRLLARRYGTAVLLKGTPSLVAPADAEGPLLVSASGSSDLARAGMGDVLSGVAGAFLARGAGPFEAAGLGLHHTGRAAARAGKGEGLLPSDVIRELGATLSESGDGERGVDLPSVLLDLPRLP
jgi:ADP-dependent NAD(P)H-hydrate dehydratase / NAD(P)H-hydrate epimerase